MPEPMPIEVHKALADDTRYRLYRYLRLSGRPVPIRELATRLALHPNTLRPHLRRLEEAGLVASEARKQTGVGRPQTLYAAVDVEGREGRDYRLLADVLSGLLTTSAQRSKAREMGREWGAYLVARAAPRPRPRRGSGVNLAVLQEAMDAAGFTPRFRRRGATSVDITMRGCPFPDLLEEHRDLVCAVHRGLLEGILAASRPALRITSADLPAERGTACRLSARGS